MPRILLLALIFCCVPLGAQEEAIDSIVEQTHQLESEYRCLAGDVIACFKAAGLDCEPLGDDLDSVICLSSNQATYKIRKNRSKEWTIEVLREMPLELFQD